MEQWPEEDLRRWAESSEPPKLFDDVDRRLASLAWVTRQKYARGWGRWLAFLAHHAVEVLELSPADRCTKGLIQDYVDHLRRSGNSYGTVVGRLGELAAVTAALDPKFDSALINRFISTLKSKVKPVRGKSHIRFASELVDLGFHLVKSATAYDLVSARAFRDGLIIAFLALHPIRRRNLVAFCIDKNLIRQDGGYMVVYSGSETKNGAPFEFPLASVLIDPMTEYFQIWRPILMAQKGRKSRAIDKSVWVSCVGSPMSPNAMSGVVRKRTYEAFGKAMSPHDFRSAAATTVAVIDPLHVCSTAPLLGHRSLKTTERYYIQATGLEAQRSYLDVLEDYRKGGKR